MGSSRLQVARRALVVLIKAVAAQCNIVVSISIDAADKDVTAAFKRVALKVHPDKEATKMMSKSCRRRVNTAKRSNWASRAAHSKGQRSRPPQIQALTC